MFRMPLRRFVGRVAAASLAVAAPVALTPTLASAASPTDLFFSEYIEGSSYNKAVEIYNGTSGVRRPRCRRLRRRASTSTAPPRSASPCP